ncbi:hypothetical protein M758_8G088300 [Ceratodon purpureus]|nr:hypothetical protein M758_8G088300 [Ceratodon purpureus]
MSNHKLPQSSHPINDHNDHNEKSIAESSRYLSTRQDTTTFTTGSDSYSNNPHNSPSDNTVNSSSNAFIGSRKHKTNLHQHQTLPPPKLYTSSPLLTIKSAAKVSSMRR